MKEKTQKPQFAKTTGEKLYQQLREEVNETVRTLEPQRKFEIALKAILFPFMYFFSYAAALIWGINTAIFYFCYFIMGLLLVFNFLNLIHEAVHGTLFKDKKLNARYIYLFDLMGANSYIWKIRHIRLHHNYPNIMGWDSDLEQSPMVRIFPAAPFLKLHRYQHLYMPFIYPFYLFNWLLIRDFKDFFNKRKQVWKVIDGIPAIEYFKLFLFKIIFLFYTIILPVPALHISLWHTIAAFMIMMFSASIFSLLVLLPPHANIKSEFPLPVNDSKIGHGWLQHQLHCTNDVKGDSWFTRFFMGCFNMHIAHHLFPSVNHVYYPEITQIIKRFAQKNNLPYRQFSLGASLHNHYLLLKNNAFRENIFEETM